MKTKLIAGISVLVFFGLMALYAQEFGYLGNTIGVRWLLVGSLFTGAVAASVLLYYLRDRFSPIVKHFPEVSFIAVMFLLFAPLFGSLLNRIASKSDHISFEFVSESPIIASNYGLLKGEKIKPNAYRLQVRKSGKDYTFTYKSQAYYPITKPGEKVLLPVKKGLFGLPVVVLR